MRNKYEQNVKIAVVLLVTVVSSACLLSGCPEIGEQPSSLSSRVELLPGSPGYGGNEAVYGLLNGAYLVKHQKRQTRQEKDPAGRIQIFHEEDWYAVGSDGTVSQIASSKDGIPADAESALLERGWYPLRVPDSHSSGNKTDAYESYHENRYTAYAVNFIKGLVNGETYGVYRYGILSNGDKIGRYEGTVQTEDANTLVNLKGMSAGESIGLFDAAVTTAGSGLLNGSNHLVVLTPTRLYWTKTPQTIVTNIRLRGYDYDIIIEDRNPTDGHAAVSAVASEGQQYFILTGSSKFAGYIRIVDKE